MLKIVENITDKMVENYQQFSISSHNIKENGRIMSNMLYYDAQKRGGNVVNPDMLFGVDTGRGKGNFIGSNGKKVEIPSYVMEGYNMEGHDPRNEPGNIVTYYEGKEYWVGDYARIQTKGRKNMRKTKVHINQLVLGLTGLALAGASGNVAIATCVPISRFSKDALKVKEQFEGEHTIDVNGNRITINIVKCLVGIESGVYFNLLNNPMGVVRIVDPGARTTNYCTFRDKKYVGQPESGTLEEGWENFDFKTPNHADEFAEYLTDHLGGVWEEDDLTYIIGGRATELVEPFKRRGFLHARLPQLPEGFHTGFTNAIACLESVQRSMAVASK